MIPKSKDILCGQSLLFVSHPGNITFQWVLGDYAHTYNVTSKQEKIHNLGGHFLKFREEDMWEEISAVADRDKVMHALGKKVSLLKCQHKQTSLMCVKKFTEKLSDKPEFDFVLLEEQIVVASVNGMAKKHYMIEEPKVKKPKAWVLVKPELDFVLLGMAKRGAINDEEKAAIESILNEKRARCGIKEALTTVDAFLEMLFPGQGGKIDLLLQEVPKLGLENRNLEDCIKEIKLKAKELCSLVCAETDFTEGVSHGDLDGFEEGATNGSTKGVSQGDLDGFVEGATEGFAKGVSQGVSNGVSKGFVERVSKCEAVNCGSPRGFNPDWSMQQCQEEQQWKM